MKAYFFALLTALIWGLVPLIEKFGLRQGVEPWVAITVRSLGIAVCFAFLMLFHREPVFQVVRSNPAALWAFVASGVLAAVIGYTAFYYALKFGEVSVVTPLAATYPLVTYLLAVLLFHEPITLARLAGVSLVVVGIFLLR